MRNKVLTPMSKRLWLMVSAPDTWSPPGLFRKNHRTGSFHILTKAQVCLHRPVSKSPSARFALGLKDGGLKLILSKQQMGMVGNKDVPLGP